MWPKLNDRIINNDAIQPNRSRFLSFNQGIVYWVTYNGYQKISGHWCIFYTFWLDHSFSLVVEGCFLWGRYFLCKIIFGYYTKLLFKAKMLKISNNPQICCGIVKRTILNVTKKKNMGTSFYHFYKCLMAIKSANLIQ